MISKSSIVLGLLVTALTVTKAINAEDSTTTNIPGGIQKLFDEVQLPCTPRAVLNHPCYFCKCDVHGNRQHCVYTCSPTSGNPKIPGSQVCSADDNIQQGCKRCRCSSGQIFFDCFLSLQCNNEIQMEENNDF
ncbi:uncharacterized protein LOC131684673 [Topomyia yanbarensis]|uniref:uncharacterized protein LOC131684673 n=1 Tax=Topomyia yanbarensis TaxID=2498891 RepID=UPI00273C0469|nr:uncharacterized protein LOC131684673 [Topomyia yanbarensis]